MPEKIQAFCEEKGQAIPQTKGEIIRTVYESLALRYATVWEKLMTYTETPPRSLHIVGGGCQDKLLNQFAANAIGVTVKASPVEATGLGNILAQMLADGAIKSIEEGRAIVVNSSIVETFEPNDSDVWTEAKKKFPAIVN
jgi:sugar (pentulose or hexulose) kinase